MNLKSINNLKILITLVMIKIPKIKKLESKRWSRKKDIKLTMNILL